MGYVTTSQALRQSSRLAQRDWRSGAVSGGICASAPVRQSLIGRGTTGAAAQRPPPRPTPRAVAKPYHRLSAGRLDAFGSPTSARRTDGG